MGRRRSRPKQFTGVLGFQFSSLTKLLSAAAQQRNVSEAGRAWTKREKTSPRREKRGATARPLPRVPGRMSGLGRASEWLQRRSLKTQEFFSSSTNDVPADFVLSLRRFVSHRNAFVLRTRRFARTVRGQGGRTLVREDSLRSTLKFFTTGLSRVPSEAAGGKFARP